MLLLTNPNWPPRLWWLWPLQVVVLAASVTYIPSRLKAPRGVTWIGQGLLFFILLGNPLLLSRLDSWLSTGYSGSEAELAQAVDYIAGQLRSDGKERAAIGYQIFTATYVSDFHVVEPRYKVGADLDLLFKYRHEISNTNRCAEGILPDDEYRIVESSPDVNGPPAFRFVRALDSDFRLLQQFGSFQVFKRDKLI